MQKNGMSKFSRPSAYSSFITSEQKQEQKKLKVKKQNVLTSAQSSRFCRHEH